MGTRSARGQPTVVPAVLVRRHDAHRVLTGITLCGLLIAILLGLLGLPATNFDGPLHDLGVMGPLCGATRSVYLTLHGHLPDALRYNPAGPALVVAAVALLVRAVVGWSTGRWVDVHLPRRLVIPVAVITLAALEVNQQLHAALLMQPWAGSVPL